MRVFLIAGEPSGDKLGGALMEALARLVPGVAFDGVGGPMMAAGGLVSRFAMDELSVMGIAEVLPRYRQLKRRIAETAAAVAGTRPDVLITIDSPDFCLRVAKKVRAADRTIRIVHYVAPSVWAWRPGRAAKMARHVDQVLALLPFEPPFFEAVGLRCDFVGHPIAAEPQAGPDEVAAFRRGAGLGAAPVAVVLPGSRRSEVERLAPVFGAALGPVVAAHPGLRVVVPAAAPVADVVAEAAAEWPGDPHVLDPRGMDPELAQMVKRAAFASGTVALAASGTVSLELAAAGTPMVVAYDMSWLSWQIMSRMARIDTVTLVNLVADSRTVPEFLGPACRPDPIAHALNALIDDPARRALQLDAMATTMARLGRGGEAPGMRAARAVLDGLRQAA
jgi:lipid-A-disaccharide synthase